MPLSIDGADGARALLGCELGVGPWLRVTQEAIDAFAAATGDHQWIHVDPARAGAGPFGSTIAHGLLTLSLGPQWSYGIFEFSGFSFAMNYGYDKVRFPAPLPAGSRLRMRASLVAVEDVPGGIQVTVRQTFEIEGSEKPVCVAESVSRLVA
jgi:acyl dehydratase